MTAAILLTCYCGLIVAASLVGGYLPMLFRLTHRHLEMAISFVAGVILGVGVLHLLPHAVIALGAVEPAVAWMLGGYLLMFFLDRFFHFHRHDAPEGESPGDHECANRGHGDHGHSHGAEAASPLAHAAFSWGAAAVGMTIHSLVEGLALAAAVDADLHEDTSFHWAGLGAFLAIVLHKPLDSLTVGTLMAATDHPRRRRNIVNGLFALAAPGGVLAFYVFALTSASEESRVLGPALAFAAGAFVCIASSDLLPELHFHSHDRIKLSACLLLGIALAVALVALEHGADGGHDHAGHKRGGGDQGGP